MGEILLDRPKAGNALTTSMIEAIDGALEEWREDHSVDHVVIRSSGKHFCAGGDIRQVRNWVIAGNEEACRNFFAAEYRMNARIAAYPKAIVSLIDGACMGGGIGLTVYGRYRVTTPGARFAMPETAIGFFPDVGGSWLLPRLSGGVGKLLGLTGRAIGGATAVYCGLATHLVDAEKHAAISENLAQCSAASIDELLASAVVKGDRLEFDTLVEMARSCFNPFKDVHDIFEELASRAEPEARSLLDTMKARSPTAMLTTAKLQEVGVRSNLNAMLDIELETALAMIRHPDFIEGVRAVLVEKSNDARWNPQTIVGAESLVPAVGHEHA